VSWPSLFWGLFALALQAMALPPMLGDNAKSSSILIPERANPLVCLSDIFSVIGYFLIASSKEKSLGTIAALVWHWWLEDRYGTGNKEYPNLLNTPIRNHPRASTLLFLGSLTQAIKIFSFQGIVWPKVLGAIYLTAYCIPAALLILAKSDFTYQQLNKSDTFSFTQGRKRSWTPMFTATAFGLCCWTLTKIVLKYNLAAPMEPDDPGGIFARGTFHGWMTLLGVTAGGSVRGTVIFYFFGVLLWLLVSLVQFNQKGTSTPGRVFLSLLCVLYIGVDCVIIYYLVPWILNVEPSAQVAAALFSVLLLLILMGLLCVMVRILDLLSIWILRVRGQKVVNKWSPFAVVLVCIYFLVALLHFVFVYDASGTAKPHWTEVLG
jgi:hypothetical protein